MPFVLDGKRLSARSFVPPAGTELFRWEDVPERDQAKVTLAPGAYAVVRCLGEKFFRALHTEPARLGEAGGHPTLANLHPVLFAGEVCRPGFLVGFLVSGVGLLLDPI